MKRSEIIERIFKALDKINPSHDKIIVNKHLESKDDSQLEQLATDLEAIAS